MSAAETVGAASAHTNDDAAIGLDPTIFATRGSARRRSLRGGRRSRPG